MLGRSLYTVHMSIVAFSILTILLLVCRDWDFNSRRFEANILSSTTRNIIFCSFIIYMFNSKPSYFITVVIRIIAIEYVIDFSYDFTCLYIRDRELCYVSVHYGAYTHTYRVLTCIHICIRAYKHIQHMYYIHVGIRELHL